MGLFGVARVSNPSGVEAWVNIFNARVQVIHLVYVVY